MQIHLLNLLGIQQLIISPFTYFPIILALKKLRSLFHVLKGQFEQMVMEGSSQCSSLVRKSFLQAQKQQERKGTLETPKFSITEIRVSPDL